VKNLSILGSTGSIGRAALDVASAFPDRFRVVALAAGRSIERLAGQVARHEPLLVSVEREEDVSSLRALLPAGFAGRIVCGPAGLEEAASLPEADVVVAGLVGAVGLRSAHAAVLAGKRLALANKEALVVAGEMIVAAARKSGAEIVPVDSEHSAIHQALRCGRREEVERLVLTGSGGPLRERELASFGSVTVEEALAHPTWDMGPVVTINSATLVNKGLEVIEAHLLFGIPFDRIEVVVHPTSVVHSMVEFVDGSTLVQASPPTMLIPIALGLAWPDRVPGAAPAVDWTRAETWEFAPLDDEAFPAVALAREAGARGGTAPAVYNAANEVCVEAFRSGRLRFVDIVPTVGAVLATHDVPSDGGLTVEDVLGADAWARAAASDRIEGLA